MKRCVLAVAISLCVNPAADAASKVVGVIKDQQKQLAGATVRVQGQPISAVSDYQGRFELPALDAGTYQLDVQYRGYPSKQVAVIVKDEAITQIQPIVFNDTAEMEVVQVVGSIIWGEMAAANSQKNASHIKNIISADGIGKLPDRNAAEAVQRIPGVSIERDQGEGRFVAVRGLPSQWSSASINGNRLPTAEEETTSRATAFDFFPSELIEVVEVSKALTPDMEAMPLAVM